jgi:hypothetical protein
LCCLTDGSKQHCEGVWLMVYSAPGSALLSNRA